MNAEQSGGKPSLLDRLDASKQRVADESDSLMYSVEITEILQRKVDVRAKSAEEAEEIVRGMYNREQIVLDAEDFVGMELSVAVKASEYEHKRGGEAL